VLVFLWAISPVIAFLHCSNFRIITVPDFCCSEADVVQ
jgi:hypothetical protein